MLSLCPILASAGGEGVGISQCVTVLADLFGRQYAYNYQTSSQEVGRGNW